jgi:hypothetical protein
MGRIEDHNVRDERLRHYIEKWGLLFEQLGATRMAGRVIGWLLICDPPHRTAAQIAIATGASAASVSTATRWLTQAAMVERVGMPGERSVFFRIAPGMWARLMRIRLGRISSMEALAEEGLLIVGPREDEQGDRLREIRSYSSFMERELPALLSRWEQEWEREKRARRKGGRR